MPDLELALPDGRKLARIGNLVLVPQESTLVLGPSGAGKSTLFRAIAGFGRYGKGEILQPAHAKLMLLPQRPYIPIGPLRDAIAYPSAPHDLFRGGAASALVDVGLPALARPAGRERQLADAAVRRRTAAARRRPRAAGQARLAVPRRGDRLARRGERKRALSRHRRSACRRPTIVSIGHRSTLKAFHERQISLTDPRRGSRRRIIG